MANVNLHCIRECRLTNAQGLAEHYEDEPEGNIYQVTEERASELLATGNFETAPPGSAPHTSFVGAAAPASPAAPTSFSAPPPSSGVVTDPDPGE